MAVKDYYAILMVHPKAELFLIEAAYKRLAREYHPDLGNDSTNHDRMVEINEAYEVLSDPKSRRLYDENYAQLIPITFPANAANAYTTRPAKAESASHSSRQQNKSADARWGEVSPVRPTPSAFGIEANYLKRALEGARVWKVREHRIPDKVKWVTRILCGLTGLAISILVVHLHWPGLEKIAMFAWVAIPLIGELTIRGIEKIRDVHLLRYKYNPLYNPNPVGYQNYAAAHAAYESNTARVYVTRDSTYHSDKNCPGMSTYEPMPKWFAEARNAKPCSRCGHLTQIEPKWLPPPFGKGRSI